MPSKKKTFAPFLIMITDGAISERLVDEDAAELFDKTDVATMNKSL